MGPYNHGYLFRYIYVRWLYEWAYGIPEKKYLWKIKVPLQIQILMWFLYKTVIFNKGQPG
jgi:hypothetical protein